MPSWREYLPHPGDTRGVVAEAIAKTSSPAMPLDALAAEAVRQLVLTDHAMDVMRPHRDRIARAAADLTGDDPFGILAAATVLLVHGVEVPGHSIDREVACLTALAARGVRSRRLAFAALGVGRVDLATTFSGDLAVAALAGADAEGFARFVAEFPTSDVDYAELGLVARAYKALVERHHPGGAARWLHRTVHEGPQPVYVPRIPKPIPTIVPTWIGFWAIHGLYGGDAIDVAHDGTLTCIARAAGGDPVVTTRMLSTAERTALEEAVANSDPRTIVVSPRDGVPDESSTQLTYVCEGRTMRIWKWDRDPHVAFEALVRHLRALAR